MPTSKIQGEGGEGGRETHRLTPCTSNFAGSSLRNTPRKDQRDARDLHPMLRGHDLREKGQTQRQKLKRTLTQKREEQAGAQRPRTDATQRAVSGYSTVQGIINEGQGRKTSRVDTCPRYIPLEFHGICPASSEYLVSYFHK